MNTNPFPPLMAVTGCFYREIIKSSKAYLKPGGMLAFETGYDQAADVASMLSGSFKDTRIYKDLAGIDRVVTSILSPAAP